MFYDMSDIITQNELIFTGISIVSKLISWNVFVHWANFRSKEDQQTPQESFQIVLNT
jgi:hypothetical protein